MKTFNKDNTNVGDIVYSIDFWSGRVEKGCVIEILDAGTRFKCLSFVDEGGNDIDQNSGIASAPWRNLYTTAKDAYENRKTNADAKFQEFCSQIHTIEDLVRFPLTYCINGDEHTDWNAKRAYEQRARELGVLNKEQAMSL